MFSGDHEEPYFEISGDSRYVVYYGPDNTFGYSELYCVPITGGTPRKLNDDLIDGLVYCNGYCSLGRLFSGNVV
jgi:hypothetical protein